MFALTLALASQAACDKHLVRLRLVRKESDITSRMTFMHQRCSFSCLTHGHCRATRGARQQWHALVTLGVGQPTQADQAPPDGGDVH